jgi:hypothetical protein
MDSNIYQENNIFDDILKDDLINIDLINIDLLNLNLESVSNVIEKVNKNINKETKHPRRFQCLTCLENNIIKCFTRTEQLKDHIMVIHKNTRPYKCEFCKNTFTNKSALNKHKLCNTTKIKN